MDTTTLPPPDEELALPHLEERLLAALRDRHGDAVPAPAPRRDAGRRRLALLAGAAAVVAGVVAIAPWGVEESSADALVRDTALTMRAALADTGRATATVVNVDDGERSGGNVTLFEFAGDDERYRPAQGGYDNRIVDGQNYIQGFESRHPERWYRVLCNDGIQRATPDPRDLAAVLTPAADFDFAGEEVVDGVPTRHLRADNPAAVPAAAIEGESEDGAVVSALDIWVDGDDVTRRLDAHVETTWENTDAEADGDRTATAVTEWSIEFSDLGDDIVIPAPAEFVDETCEDTPPA